MATFDDFWSALKPALEGFAKDSWHDLSSAAIKDAQAFVKDNKEDLQRWTELLAEDKVTRTDYEWLVASKKDLAKLTFLKQEGLAQVALDRFTSGLVDTIVSTAFKIFFPVA
jgi:hypothetical protein